MSLLDSIGNIRVDVSKAAVYHMPELVIDERTMFDDLVREYVYYDLWVSFSINLFDVESYQKIFKRNRRVFCEYLLCLPYVGEVSDVYICRGISLDFFRMSIGLKVDVNNNALSVYRLISSIIGIMSYIKSLKEVVFLWYDRGMVGRASFLKDERIFDGVGTVFSYNLAQICRHLLGRPKSDLETGVLKKIIKRHEERARVKSAVSRIFDSIVVRSQEKPEIAKTPYTEFLGTGARKSAF